MCAFNLMCLRGILFNLVNLSAETTFEIYSRAAQRQLAAVTTLLCIHSTPKDCHRRWQFVWLRARQPQMPQRRRARFCAIAARHWRVSTAPLPAPPPTTPAYELLRDARRPDRTAVLRALATVSDTILKRRDNLEPRN